MDANVIVDAQVRDLFCRLAEAELVEFRWSDRILDEATRALTDNLGIDPDGVERLMMALRRAFPDATAFDFDGLESTLTLPDPDDRHVVAAAVRTECDWLLTYNIRDFPDATLEPFGVSPMTPDDALVLVSSWFRERMAAVVTAQVGALRRSPMTLDEFIERLSARAPLGAIVLGNAMGLDRYERMFAEVTDAHDRDSPQGAVDHLLDVVEHGRHAEVPALVAPALAVRLTGSASPEPNALCAVLQHALDDTWTSSGWGWATARRPTGPGTELVKLLQAGDEYSIAYEERWARGHLFEMQMSDFGWVLIDLDGPDPAAAPGAER